MGGVFGMGLGILISAIILWVMPYAASVVIVKPG
jgi:hypothetical protein